MFAPVKRTKSNYSNKPNKILRKKTEKELASEDCKKLYQKYFIKTNMNILNQINRDYLSFNLNDYDITDISIISELLSKYYYFQQIEVAPFDPNKGDPSERNKIPNITSKKGKKYKSEKEEKKLQLYSKIIYGLSRHLSLSNRILSFTLCFFKLSQKMCNYLSQALIDNKSLQSLSISNCSFILSSYEILLKGLLNHKAITYLDLSNNNMNDKFGNMISRIIIRQAQRRDQTIWSYSLRNEQPLNNDYKNGLISINLSGNKLNKDSAECICNALSCDQYIRSIDISYNEIDAHSCKKFNYMMRKNITLLTLDLRNNPGYDDYIHPRLVMKMSKNIRYLYQQYQKGEYTEEDFENMKEFIDSSFFDVDIPQEIVEFYNSNLPENNEDVNSDSLANQNMNNENNNKEQQILDLHQQNDDAMSDIQEKEEFEEEDEEATTKSNKKKGKNKTISSTKDNNMSEENKKLIKENLELKQQIIELKAKTLQQQLNLENNKSNDNNNKNKTIDADYSRVLELINELNDVMNNIEIKKKQINNNNNVNNSQQPQVMRNMENNIQNNLNEEPQINQNYEDEIKNKNNDEEKNVHSEENEVEKNKYEEQKNNENENKEEKNTENNNEGGPYQEMIENESSDDKNKENEKVSSENSQIVDEDGNVFNMDQLTEEEKQAILQQQMILQKLQEEAEARGEHFDPQEYIAFLEEQAKEEELGEEHEHGGEEQEQGEEISEGESNKVNKSF